MRICPQCGTRFQEALQFCPNDGAQTYEAQDSQESPTDPLLGRVIDGRYRIEKQIGEGGMGVVYMATHTVLQKKLALKVLRGDSSKDADVVQRFMQEAQAATSIGHQNIIDISDFGRLPDGSVYFVMEYLDGLSLSDMIKRGGSIPMADAVHIIRQIASALDAAHARGIVHRDLKPDNIIVVNLGDDPLFVKVLDFGVAKVGGGASKLTKTGMVFGTPHYMSPEQAAGHSVDARTDIYALGVIMYEMFTGKVPFDADTFMGILSKHMFEPPASPSEVKGASLGALESVTLRALEKNPDQRYLSMQELIGDLDTVAAGGSVSVGGRPGVSPPGNLADALEPPSHLEVAAQPSGGGSKLALVAVAVLALLLVGGGVGTAVFLMTGDDEGQAMAQQSETPPPPPTEIAPDPDTAPDPAASDPAGQVEPATPSAPEVATIEISSDPAGAEVLLDGVMLGNTPIRVERPSEGTREVTLRLRGHETTPVQISPQSGDSLSITLEPERAAPSRRSRSGGRSRSSETTATPPPAEQPTRPARRSTTSEVVDPWAM